MLSECSERVRPGVSRRIHDCSSCRDPTCSRRAAVPVDAAAVRRIHVQLRRIWRVLRRRPPVAGGLARDRAARPTRATARVSASAIAAQQPRRGAPTRIAGNATALLANPDTVAIVTGQQAGMFGGPLFTVLKAISAIQLARRALAELGTPVVPVFWVAAEDHDWEEIASVHGPRRAAPAAAPLRVPPPEGAGDRPVGALTLDDHVDAALDELDSALAATEFTLVAARRALRATYQPGAGVGDAFARWMESFLGQHGLVVFDVDRSRVKPLLRDLFRREVASPGGRHRWRRKAGEALAACGHSRRWCRRPTRCRSSGWTAPARRPRQHQEDRLRRRRPTLSAADLEEEAAQSPEHFSPNVLLRPVVQDTLFPTICYVAGPSELAYLGQLRRGLRALRSADAARSSPRDGHSGRFRHHPLPQQVRRPARRSAAAGRRRAESPAAGAAAADGGRGLRRRRARR